MAPEPTQEPKTNQNRHMEALNAQSKSRCAEEVVLIGGFEPYETARKV